jgi:hypothetical protein
VSSTPSLLKGFQMLDPLLSDLSSIASLASFGIDLLNKKKGEEQMMNAIRD